MGPASTSRPHPRKIEASKPYRFGDEIKGFFRPSVVPAQMQMYFFWMWSKSMAVEGAVLSGMAVCQLPATPTGGQESHQSTVYTRKYRAGRPKFRPSYIRIVQPTEQTGTNADVRGIKLMIYG